MPLHQTHQPNSTLTCSRQTHDVPTQNRPESIERQMPSALLRLSEAIRPTIILHLAPRPIGTQSGG